ncbi:MAG: porphobilinogen synthase, partial [SAR202 cluster bacterium]|nr:porphobilinogen synthase [SAR202 cluster bacterium]
MTGFPQVRMRRLRQHAGIRKLVQETRFSVENLIYPLFVRHGRDVRSEIAPMPDIFQLSLDQLINEVGEASELGVEAVLLFGIPETKDPEGTEAYEPGGIIQEAVRAIKQALSEMLVITDVCLCEFTDHGHCGIIKGDRIDNDATLELLARMAVCQAEAGADIVAPSAMMDGQVGAIRTALDEAGYEDTPIMAYSAKYSSGFYGPFRIAAESAPQFGDRTGYQMDPPDIQQAMREIELDIQEGADIVMVKPALAYLDVLAAAKKKYGYP